MIMEKPAAVLERVRSPIVGGFFYPESCIELLARLRGFGLEPGRGGQAQAIIAPHGGWDISGILAGAAFQAASGRNPSRVALLGPLHNARETGLFLSNSHSFETPLGNIFVDREISEKLEARHPLFQIYDIPHLEEHSLEVLLPFVKYCFPDALIIPVLMGQPSEPAISALAGALENVFAPIMNDTLLVVSCNLSMTPNKTAAHLFAVEAMRLFAGKRADELTAAVLGGKICACGGAVMAGVLKSGLLDDRRPCPVPLSMISAKDNEGSTIFYGALSFE